MPAIFDNSEVQFLYPENWSLTEDEKEEWPRALTLQSPSSGFWMLHIYPTRENPHLLARDAVQAIRDDYEDVESEEVSERIGPCDATGFNMDFVYLDFIVRAEVRSFAKGARTYVVHCQAESREFDQLADVFRAITLSLIQS